MTSVVGVVLGIRLLDGRLDATHVAGSGFVQGGILLVSGPGWLCQVPGLGAQPMPSRHCCRSRSRIASKVPARVKPARRRSGLLDGTNPFHRRLRVPEVP